MQLSAEEREEAIEAARRECERAQTPALKRYHWSMMVNLIHGRSPEQVRKMEIERSLRAA